MAKILKVLLLSFKKVYNTYWEDGLLRKLLTAQAWEFKFRSLHPWKSQSVAEIAGSMRLTGMSSSSNEWASGWEESLSRRIRWREIKASVVSTCTHTCVWWHLCVPHSQMQSLLSMYTLLYKNISEIIFITLTVSQWPRFPRSPAFLFFQSWRPLFHSQLLWGQFSYTPYIGENQRHLSSSFWII